MTGVTSMTSGSESSERRPPTSGGSTVGAGAPRTPEEEWRILPRILVIDDEPSVVDVLQEFLAAQGYEITVAGSGEEGLRMVHDLRPDIILTDINLPGLSG